MVAQFSRRIPVAFESSQVFQVVDSACNPVAVAQLLGIGETCLGVVTGPHGPTGNEQDGGGPVEGGSLQIGPADMSGEVYGAEAFLQALWQFKVVPVDAAGIGGGVHLQGDVALSASNFNCAQVRIVGLLVVASLKRRCPNVPSPQPSRTV